MPADQTQQFPVQRPSATEAGTGSPTGGSAPSEQSDSADELRILARKALGLVAGLVLLIGCGFAVTHLTAWGQRWTMPLVFVVFVLVMMLASNLVVGGATAVWNAARAGAR